MQYFSVKSVLTVGTRFPIEGDAHTTWQHTIRRVLESASIGYILRAKPKAMVSKGYHKTRELLRIEIVHFSLSLLRCIKFVLSASQIVGKKTSLGVFRTLLSFICGLVTVISG